MTFSPHWSQNSWFSIVMLSMIAVGCTTSPTNEPLIPLAAKRISMGASACLDLYAALDRETTRHGVTNFGPSKIVEFPYLRSNRFLASFNSQLKAEKELTYWMSLMASLDMQSRIIEYGNLPIDAQQTVATHVDTQQGVIHRLMACSEQLMRGDQTSVEAIDRLRTNTIVPTDYDDSVRISGIYGITTAFIRSGVDDWHAQTAKTFKTLNAFVQPEGHYTRYRPDKTLTPEQRRRIRAEFQHRLPNPLNIPLPNVKQLGSLFEAYAPIWEIDTLGDADRIGEPFWSGDGQPDVNLNKVTVYTYPSHVRLNGQSLLQLNYTVWFRERPKDGIFDMLSGRLDGLTWRVTLDASGSVMLRDVIHNCGCYHMFFPTNQLTTKTNMPSSTEPPLIIRAPLNETQGRTVIRVSANDHQVQRVYNDETLSKDTPYQLASYDKLLSLPHRGDRRKSLFDAEGYIPGTDRGERFFFWPTGIVNAGAMRQRGHHATAFIGERHFDDVDLLQKLFNWSNSEARATPSQ